VNAYQEWCQLNGRDPSAAAMTAGSVASWLSEIAPRYAPSSLSVLRAAAGSFWRDALLPGRSPTEDERVSRIVAGLQKRRALEEAAKPARPTTIALTGDLLISSAPFLQTPWRNRTPRDEMLWAAATLGVFGLLRPGELLGSARERSRAARADAVLFYASPGAVAVRAVRPLSPAPSDIPDHFTVQLGVTKADPFARNTDLAISAPTAVEALWRWMHTRAALGLPADGPLFALPSPTGFACLSCAQLCGEIAAWIALVSGGPPPKVTGRCFRKGGASALLAGGAAVPAIMQSARWKSAAMVGVYADAASKRQRALLTNRRMDAAAVAGAAAAVSRRR
jgi:integrase